MATYDITNFTIYDGGTEALLNNLAITETLDNSLGAGVGDFTIGETVGTIGAASLTYAGTKEIDGVVYPVLNIVGGANDGNLAVGSFQDISGVAPDPLGGFTTETFTTCFAAGTEIATAVGIALVEELKIGDMVRTMDGRDVAVKWIGRQTVSTKFGPAERLTPVKVSAGALGENLPTKDLIVTADHALLIGDTLCAAGALVNGTTIARTHDLGETFTVYHVETEEHEVILANGVAAETFIDNVARTAFDNFAEFDALYGDVAEMKELDYPRAMTARQVPAAIKAALAAEKVA